MPTPWAWSSNGKKQRSDSAGETAPLTRRRLRRPVRPKQNSRTAGEPARAAGGPRGPAEGFYVPDGILRSQNPVQSNHLVKLNSAEDIRAPTGHRSRSIGYADQPGKDASSLRSLAARLLSFTLTPEARGAGPGRDKPSASTNEDPQTPKGLLPPGPQGRGECPRTGKTPVQTFPRDSVPGKASRQGCRYAAAATRPSP